MIVHGRLRGINFLAGVYIANEESFTVFFSSEGIEAFFYGVLRKITFKKFFVVGGTFPDFWVINPFWDFPVIGSQILWKLSRPIWFWLNFIPLDLTVTLCNLNFKNLIWVIWLFTLFRDLILFFFSKIP